MLKKTNIVRNGRYKSYLPFHTIFFFFSFSIERSIYWTQSCSQNWLIGASILTFHYFGYQLPLSPLIKFIIFQGIPSIVPNCIVSPPFPLLSTPSSALHTTAPVASKHWKKWKDTSLDPPDFFLKHNDKKYPPLKDGEEPRPAVRNPYLLL